MECCFHPSHAGVGDDELRLRRRRNLAGHHAGIKALCCGHGTTQTVVFEWQMWMNGKKPCIKRTFVHLSQKSQTRTQIGLYTPPDWHLNKTKCKHQKKKRQQPLAQLCAWRWAHGTANVHRIRQESNIWQQKIKHTHTHGAKIWITAVSYCGILQSKVITVTHTLVPINPKKSWCPNARKPLKSVTLRWAGRRMRCTNNKGGNDES